MSKKLGLTALATLVLTGCSAVQKANDSYDNTEAFAKKSIQASEANKDNLYKIDQAGVYVDKTPIDTHSLDSKQNLPKSFNKHLVANHQQTMSKTDLASYLTKVTGIKTIIQQDLLNDGTGSVEEVIYTGSAKGLFDHVTSKLNVSWKWDQGAVVIYKYETKMFSLDALSGVNKLTANLNTANSTSGSSSSTSSSSSSVNSGQQTQIDNTINIWEEVGASIQGVLSENEKLSLMPSAGKIVVQASPANMRKVENIVKHANAFYSKLVRLDIKVYQVESNDSDNYGINWSSLWEQTSGRFNAAVTMGGTLDGTVVKIGTKGGGSLSSADIAAQALSEVGKTSLLRSNSVVTINNQPVPLNVAKEISYVQSTSVSNSDSSSSTEITPGIVTEGFSMNLTPLVNDKGDILLQYAVDSATVESITDFASADGTSRVQLPTRSVNNFLQRVSIRNGESMVLTSFQEAKGDHTDAGVGSAKAWFLGGSRKAEHKLRTVVVVVTPYILK